MEISHAAESLSHMLRFPTISVRGKPEANREAFEGFLSYLEMRYPRVFQRGAERVGDSGIIIRLQGKNRTASVLMAHYDVVDATGEWDHPPFSGMIRDGFLWGRGAIDTKITLCGILEAAEEAIAEGVEPDGDIYLCFAGDEEIMGSSASMMVDVLEKRGVRPTFVLDEGGAVARDIFPGVQQACAVVGIAEKGAADVEIRASGGGGHASAPPRRTALGVAAQAVCRVQRRHFTGRVIPPVRDMFVNLSRLSDRDYIRILFGRGLLTSFFVRLLCRLGGGELYAMTHTTCAFTMASGSRQPNVLPKTASVCANIRILQGDTTKTVLARIRRYAGKDADIRLIYGSEPTKISKTDGSFSILQQVICETFEGAAVTPYLMMAASDARHYCRISDYVYRFSPVRMSKENRASIHGENERIELYKIDECAQFYKKLIQSL